MKIAVITSVYNAEKYFIQAVESALHFDELFAIILVDVPTQKNTLKDFFEILSNYNIYRILEDGIRKVNYHEAFEIYLTTNYL